MSDRIRLLILAFLVTFGVAGAALAQTDATPTPANPGPQNPRIALVIGEATYGDATLATTANDAALMAQTLQAAGFEVIGARDLDEKSLRSALKDFLAKAESIGPSMQAFVYFAGRGVQYEGDNFIVPVDAQIAHDSDVPIEAVRVADFAHALAAAPGKARIVVLDAARTTPYARQGSPLAAGLALVEPDAGVLVAFNASPGALAPDETGAYGVYGKTLAGAMREGGLSFDDVLAQTRVAVNQATQGSQVPWSASKLAEPYFVFERAAGAPPPPAAAAIAEAEKRPIRSFPAPQAYAAAVQRDSLPAYQEYLEAYPDAEQAKRVRAILAARREALFWRRSVAADTPRAYWTYLRVYPQGPHVADAQRRLAVLSARYEPPPDFAPVVYDDLPPPPPAEIVYVNRPYWVRDVDFGPPPPPPPIGFVAIEEPAWVNLPPPPPPPRAEFGVLPVLAVALPILLTARAYRDEGGRRGLAPPNAPPPAVQPAGPPKLPPSIKVRPVAATPAPAPAAPPAPAKPPTVVKPLPSLPAAGTAAPPKPALPTAAPAAGAATKPLDATKPPAAPTTPAPTPTPAPTKPTDATKAPAGAAPAAPAVVKPLGVTKPLPAGAAPVKPVVPASPAPATVKPLGAAKPPPPAAGAAKVATPAATHLDKAAIAHPPLHSAPKPAPTAQAPKPASAAPAKPKPPLPCGKPGQPKCL